MKNSSHVHKIVLFFNMVWWWDCKMNISTWGLQSRQEAVWKCQVIVEVHCIINVSLLKLSVVHNIQPVYSLCPHKGTYFYCVSANTHTTLATMIFMKFDPQETYCTLERLYFCIFMKCAVKLEFTKSNSTFTVPLYMQISNFSSRNYILKIKFKLCQQKQEF
jgi:hypothetical protein